MLKIRKLKNYCFLLQLTILFLFDTPKVLAESCAWALQNTQHYSFKFDSATRLNDKSLRIKSETDQPISYGSVVQRIHAQKYIGKRVIFSSWIKSELIEGEAKIWMRVDGKKGDKFGPIAFDNMDNRPIKKRHSWKKYEIILDINEQAEAISIGAMLSGRGQVWFDDMRFSVIPLSAPRTDLKLDQHYKKTMSKTDYKNYRSIVYAKSQQSEYLLNFKNLSFDHALDYCH